MLTSIEQSGLEVFKLEFILKLKVKRNDWLLADKQPIIELYFEFETVFKFYNLESSLQWSVLSFRRLCHTAVYMGFILWFIYVQ